MRKDLTTAFGGEPFQGETAFREKLWLVSVLAREKGVYGLCRGFSYDEIMQSRQGESKTCSWLI